jgi:hypothetical protein
MEWLMRVISRLWGVAAPAGGAEPDAVELGTVDIGSDARFGVSGDGLGRAAL